MKAQLAAFRWQKLDGEVSQRDHLIRELEVQVESAGNGAGFIDTRIENCIAISLSRPIVSILCRRATTPAVQKWSALSRLFVSIKSVCAICEDLTQTDNSIGESQRLLQQDEEKIAIWRGELDELLPELEMGRESELELSELLTQAEQAMQRWQQEWDDFNQAATTATRSECSNRVCYILKKSLAA